MKVATVHKNRDTLIIQDEQGSNDDAQELNESQDF